MLTEGKILLRVHHFVFSFIIFVNTLSVSGKLPQRIPQSNLQLMNSPRKIPPGDFSQVFELPHTLKRC